MTYRSATRLLRRHLKSARLYAYARRALLLGQFLARVPDDADFRFFQGLGVCGSGLAVDVGANGGQSAVALAICCPRFRILSFEPNPALWPDLDFVRRILGSRFDYRRYGLAERDCEMELYVPAIGGMPVTTRASIREGDATQQAEILAREIGRVPSVEVRSVRFRQFDGLNLRPHVIKIDVEGAELSVLTGMTRTLTSCRSVLMLESNSESDACRDLLRHLDYQFFTYDVASRRLRSPSQKTRNWFAVPREMVALSESGRPELSVLTRRVED